MSMDTRPHRLSFALRSLAEVEANDTEVEANDTEVEANDTEVEANDTEVEANDTEVEANDTEAVTFVAAVGRGKAVISNSVNRPS